GRVSTSTAGRGANGRTPRPRIVTNGQGMSGLARPVRPPSGPPQGGDACSGTLRLDRALLVRQLSNYVRRTRQAGSAGAGAVRAHREGAVGPAAVCIARRDREQPPVPVSPSV